MARYRKTVEELAKEIGLDVDEVLIALWDAGYDQATGPKDRLRNISYARRCLGIATHRDLKNISYWMSIFDLYESELRELVSKKLSVPIGEKAEKLSPKAVRRLISEARKRGLNPFTGKDISSGKLFKIKSKPSLKWKTIGHVRDLRWLTEEEVLGIHFELVKDLYKSPDPIEPAGIRSESLLGSAVFRPKTALGNTFKYPSVEMSAAALLYAIINVHPFHNGNKRTALVSTLVFLDENGLFPEFDQDEAFKLVLDIAQHRMTPPNQINSDDLETVAITEWLCKHCRILKRGDHAIPFRKLHRILNGYGCKVESSSGSRVNIGRTKNKSVWGLFKSTKVLNSQIMCKSENDEIGRDAIKKIRKDLYLDDLHGIDSNAFYGKEPSKTSDFIAHYRKTLLRLAKW
jgi:death-on-curing family protein